MINFISDLIYNLKREYGQPIIIQRNVKTGTSDYKTGVKGTINQIEVKIKRAIRLPDTTKRMNFPTAFQSFKQGGTTERGNRQFIIDPKDLPIDFGIPLIDDYILTNSKKYNIKTVEELDNGLGYLVTTDSTKGEPV